MSPNFRSPHAQSAFTGEPPHSRFKFLILSDLHLETALFYPTENLEFDAVILAGDILPRAEKVPTWASRRDVFGTDIPIVSVAGNHEYYGGVMQTRREALHVACIPNVHVLDPGEAMLDDGRVRVLGCTLWTDFKLPVGTATTGALEHIARAMSSARLAMSDYAMIRFQEPGGLRRSLVPMDTLAIHQTERAWLLSKLREPFDGATVVVTHHGPSMGSVAPVYADDWCTPAFVSDLPDEFFEVPALWIHGHTHTSFDYIRGGTRVVCNPRGYRMRDGSFENQQFNPALLISV